MAKILFLHHVSSIGGGSYCLLSILKSLDRTKFEPIVLLRTDGALAGEIRKLGIKVEYFPKMTTIPYNKPLYKVSSIIAYIRMIESLSSFSKILDSLDIDIVYLNNMMLYPYLKVSKKKKLKTIMHVREHWPKGEHKFQFSFAQKYAQNYADHIVAINGYSASMFSGCFNKVTVVYDWIDFTDRYKQIDFRDFFGNEENELKVMLFTGGLAKIKGTLEVIETFKKHVKGNGFRLLIMGGGFDVTPSKLHAVIENFLMLVGRIPYHIKVKRAIEADNRILVVPPTYEIVDYFMKSYCMLSYFTMPHANLAIAEAAALGLVAVAAKTEESLEYSNNGKSAVLFEYGNISDFEDKINHLIENYDQIKRRVVDNSSKVSLLFDSKKNIEILNQVCENIYSATC